MKTKILISLLLIVVIFSLCGCMPAQNSGDVENSPTKTSVDGIKYKVVTIEGHQFIATQASHGCWTFANLESNDSGTTATFKAKANGLKWDGGYTTFYFDDGGFVKVNGYHNIGIPHDCEFNLVNGQWEVKDLGNKTVDKIINDVLDDKNAANFNTKYN